ncbi:MAG TPA: hypothetical protein VFR51_11350 [Pyrinomonadaceae bacterium]|nr:hypothetical protein [Pyrinomonadaceae bacterium]
MVQIRERFGDLLKRFLLLASKVGGAANERFQVIFINCGRMPVAGFASEMIETVLLRRCRLPWLATAEWERKTLAQFGNELPIEQIERHLVAFRICTAQCRGNLFLQILQLFEPIADPFRKVLHDVEGFVRAVKFVLGILLLPEQLGCLCQLSFEVYLAAPLHLKLAKLLVDYFLQLLEVCRRVLFLVREVLTDVAMESLQAVFTTDQLVTLFPVTLDYLVEVSDQFFQSVGPFGSGFDVSVELCLLALLCGDTLRQRIKLFL